MRFLFAAFIGFLSFSSCAQKKTDLSTLTLKESAQELLQGVPGVNKGNMFDKPEMVSYGVDNNRRFSFQHYLPGHVELLSYNNQLAGYAFKINTFEDQQKIENYFKKTYPKHSAQPSKWVTQYKYADKQLVIELSSVTKERYAQKMNGYYSVKRADFFTAYSRLLQQ